MKTKRKAIAMLKNIKKVLKSFFFGCVGVGIGNVLGIVLRRFRFHKNHSDIQMIPLYDEIVPSIVLLSIILAVTAVFYFVLAFVIKKREDKSD